MSHEDSSQFVSGGRDWVAEASWWRDSWWHVAPEDDAKVELGQGLCALSRVEDAETAARRRRIEEQARARLW